ncbi:MAG: DUF4197 domain-containing protein [Bacteroidales bacterium]
MRKLIVLIALMVSFSSCELLKEFDLPEGTASAGLTEEEVARGLKEALQVGTENGVERLSKKNALYENNRLRIPFPEDAKIVEDKLRDLGMDPVVDDFIQKMNHGAEEAMTKAKPVFKDAIREMTIRDAKNILRGEDDAATQYFRQKTSERLYTLFKPEMKKTLDQMQVTDLWAKVMNAYNKIPLQQDVNADLPDYLTRQAMDRLFKVIAQEELKIRQDPQARVSELLKKVFANQ